MIIVKPNQRPRRRRAVFLVGTLFVVYSLTVFLVGLAVEREGVFSNLVRPWISGNAATLGNYVKSFGASPEHLRIDIKFEHLQKLRGQRDRALEAGSLFASRDDFVPATISCGDDETPVRLRLKGDGIQHVLSDKWSFRVSVREEKTLFGMKQFSLQHPGARNYIHEWLYHEALRREGVVSLRYKFLELSLNGKSLGVYAMEEHFEKRLLENNKRREGLIVRFDEDAMWREITDQFRPYWPVEGGQSGSYLSARVDAFQSSQLLSTAETAKRYAATVQLMEGFRTGTLATSDVFDVELLAKYFAIVDLMGAEHGSRWHNIRFYGNPITTRLEPVGFDGGGGRAITRLIGTEWEDVRQTADASRRNESFRGRLFADPLLRRAYVTQLERVSDEAYVDDLLADLSEELAEWLAIIYREWPQAPFEPVDVLRKNQGYIRSMLQPASVISAGLKSLEGDKVTIEVGNLQSLAVEVTGLVLPDEGGSLAPLMPRVIQGKWHGHTVNYQTVSFTLPKGLTWDHAIALSTRVAYRVDGAEAQRLELLTPFSLSGSVSFQHDLLRSSPNIHRYEFAEIDRAARQITIKAGRWSIREDVIAPAGYTLVIAPGTTLDLTERAVLLSYAPLDWRGTVEQPIVITSSDGTGQGVVVMEAGDESKLAHVRFEHLKSPQRDAWSLTGSVTFFKSPLVADHCAFVANKSEDGLNVFETRFTLRNCLFELSESDAFDADFCQGTIEDTQFLDVKNDCIDVSGSVVTLRRLLVDGAGDKAISSGEASNVTAEELDIRNAIIGLACKDNSELTVTGAKLLACKYPVAAFQKKPEFGSANINATNVEIIDAKEGSLVQVGSTVTLNGVRVPTRHLDILKILYAQEKRRDF